MSLKEQESTTTTASFIANQLTLNLKHEFHTSLTATLSEGTD